MCPGEHIDPRAFKRHREKPLGIDHTYYVLSSTPSEYTCQKRLGEDISIAARITDVSSHLYFGVFAHEIPHNFPLIQRVLIK